MTCARLHNFIIDNDGSRIQDDDNIGDIDPNNLQKVNGVTLYPSNDSPGNMMVYSPTMIEDDFEAIPGISMTRRFFVDFLRENNYVRPERNMMRNSKVRNMQIVEKEVNGLAEYVYDQNYFHPV